MDDEWDDDSEYTVETNYGGGEFDEEDNEEEEVSTRNRMFSKWDTWQEMFPWSDFRTYQEDAINAILKGEGML